MTIVFHFFRRRRRMLALGAASIVLHYLALDWVAARSGPAPAAAPAVVTAQLRAATPIPPPPAPVPVPVRAARLAPKRRPAPAPPESVPVPVSESESESESEPAPPIAAQPDPLPGAAEQAGPGASAPEPAPPEPAAPASAPAAPSYKASPPPSAEFALDVQRTDADGTLWSGTAVMSWRRLDGRYRMTVEAGLDMLITRINLLVLTSEGQLDDSGIAPLRATEKRKGRALTATHFDRGAGRITFSASERAYALAAGAQDKATLPFQLAAIGRADAAQLAGPIDILVGEDKEATLFRFVPAGADELDTKLGRLPTWRLSRPARPGTYSSQLDIWLAPSLGWYPVQIRNTEANGAVTTQTVSSLTLTEPSEK